MSEMDTGPREEDRPVAVEISDDMLRVTLQDGRMIATPLAWYPRLINATPEQRHNYELGLAGIHWPDIDEDLSVNGMLKGSRPPSPRTQKIQAEV
jgi:hypothetical protein